MAGKSTFLRTLGVNLVLALMGAPCCAASGKVSPIKIFTSMRTQDNLEEGISSFYAELRRIEQLLKLIESGQAIFFLLDEMFKGTNSQDRYKGGASLIRQLSELNAFGIISTHDLELAKLTANDPHVANFSFNSEIKEGEIIFNYALTKGICNDFNASALMKKSGIKILPDTEEF
jgi:DNA mismatch repair ATPase MutS